MPPLRVPFLRLSRDRLWMRRRSSPPMTHSSRALLAFALSAVSCSPASEDAPGAGRAANDAGRPDIYADVASWDDAHVSDDASTDDAASSDGAGAADVATKDETTRDSSQSDGARGSDATTQDGIIAEASSWDGNVTRKE